MNHKYLLRPWVIFTGHSLYLWIINSVIICGFKLWLRNRLSCWSFTASGFCVNDFRRSSYLGALRILSQYSSFKMKIVWWHHRSSICHLANQSTSSFMDRQSHKQDVSGCISWLSFVNVIIDVEHISRNHYAFVCLCW